MKFKHPLAAVVVSLIVSISTFAQKLVFQGKVTDVVDGSTVVVETQSQTKFVVKCQAITVPPLAELYAERSRQRLSNLVLSKIVRVEYTQRNEYGHLLATMFLNEKDVCLDQISVGLAWFDPQALSALTTSRRQLYASSEEHARQSHMGIWTMPVAATADSSVRNDSARGDRRSPVTVSESTASSLVAPNSSAEVEVRGYFRKDGTYVPAHRRTAPDRSVDNNWTTVGSINPYTGKPGTKSWFARNWWIFPAVGAVIGTSFFLRSRSGGGGGFGIPCNDGTVSQAQNRQGACSHHGGIR